MATRRRTKDSINVSKITIKGKPFFRARLVFPKDPLTGIAPPVKEFVAVRQEDAIANRKAYADKLAANPGREVDTKISFEVYLTDVFLPREYERVEADNLSLGVYRDRRGRINNYIVGSATGKIMMGQLKPAHVEALFVSFGKKKITGEVQHKIKNDLLVALRFARLKLPQGWRDYFDFDSYKIPTVASKSLAEEGFFDLDFILKTCANEKLSLKYRTMIFFELMINCRPAEMFALTWKKINFKTNEITINKAMKFTTGGFVVGLPKTGEKGERVVDMPVKLADMLQRLKKTSNSEFVFVDLEGRQLHKERFRNMWPKMVKTLNLPEGPNFYSLKTLGNSYAMANGVRPEIQAIRMGHTTDRMARKNYRKITSADQTASAYWDKLV